MDKNMDSISAESIVRHIRANRISWSGPLVRSEEDRVLKTIFFKRPNGRRSVDRLRKIWKDIVEADLPRISKEIITMEADGMTKNGSLRTLGGIGITPVIQMLRTIIADPLDGINCTLIYASKTEADIIGKEELNETAKKMPGRLKIWHTLEQPPPDWRFGKGFVSKDMMRDHLFPPSTQSLNLLSGPYPMLKALAKQLSDLGYSKQMYSRYF